MRRTTAFLAALAFAAAAGGSPAHAGDVVLPETLVTTAYNTGTTGYSQMIAVGGMLKKRYGVNLRVLPGKNDVARLAPVKAGKAQFTATGSDSVYAQEAVFAFGGEKWGPSPVRLLMLNRGKGCTTFAVAKDTGVTEMAHLKGKRIGWVRGSPALQKAVEALLGFANLTTDDVDLVEVGGWAASINGIIDGDIDASITSSSSTFMKKMEASPRGVIHPPMPHADTDGWARIQKVVPWYVPSLCTHGPGVPGGSQESIASIYPILIGTTAVSDDIAYSLTKAMVTHFDDYKDGAPAADGWALDRQLYTFYLPMHPGSITYYKEVGTWTAEGQANQEEKLQRQAVLKKAWDAHVASGPADFAKDWQAARAEALSAAGFDPVFTSW